MADNTKNNPTTTGKSGRITRTAGAFDIRNVIGMLLGLYGLILLGSYFFLNPGVDAATGQAKHAIYNLWSALALLGVAGVFFLWAKIKPITLNDTP